MKTRQNQNADTPHTPQNDNISEVRNTPKQPNNALKTRVNTSVSSAPTPKIKEQIAKWSRISWSSTQTGDLSFYGDLSHVGIVAGKDAGGKDAAGNILVINSSSGRNNVVITTNGGFGFFAKDRDAIKEYNQFILMQESKLLSSNFIKERLIAAKYGNEPFCFLNSSKNNTKRC